MEVTPKNILIFRSKTNKEPFTEWFRSLKDTRAKQKVIARLARVRTGNLGTINSVGEGVQELKIDYGPGFRIYFGQEGNELVILLCGGDKKTQDSDIREAKAYWKEFKKEKSYANY
jgi:putative addiction module killer protein